MMFDFSFGFLFKQELSSETLNGMWGYRMSDQNYKDKKTLVQYLLNAAGLNANLLMCVGPQPNGEFPALSVKALKDIGEWMDDFGDTVYGTRSTAVPPQKWGVTTHKGRRMFVHIMHPEGTSVAIPYTGNRLKAAKVYVSGENVPFKCGRDGITLNFPSVPADDIDYIAELTFADTI